MSAMKSVMVFCADKDLIELTETFFEELFTINSSFRNFDQISFFQYIFGMNDESIIYLASKLIEKII